MNHYSLLITCEHAGNNIPDEYASLFENQHAVLNSHRGWDPGSWQLAEVLGKHFNLEAIPYFYTRLLVEPNRSLDHSLLFSEFSNPLPIDIKNKLVKEYYLPYREKVESKIKQMEKPVLHLSVHTFTPVFNGEERTVDIGLLFDPMRRNEKLFCEKWRDQLVQIFPDWKITFNEPYKGIDDGFTTHLRTQFSDEQYMGIELEWNQKWATRSDAHQYYSGIIKSLCYD